MVDIDTTNLESMDTKEDSDHSSSFLINFKFKETKYIFLFEFEIKKDFPDINEIRFLAYLTFWVDK